MKISLDWLSDFINISTSDITKISDTITTNTAEIETIEAQGQDLEHIVIGKVLRITKHPNADKLKLVETNIGEKTVQIVCGGINLKKGMLTAVAAPGAQVRWHGEGDLIKLTKAKIRGEESIGMICTSSEIGLLELFPMSNEAEIMDLSKLDLKIGTPIKEALKLTDITLNIDNHAITNRADLFSHIGIAREFVANNLGTFKEHPLVGKDLNIPDQDLPINITFDETDICSRYCAVTIENIQIKESADYIKKRLQACGIRPINNIVDITNYIMLEYGTPTHAFDLDSINGKNIKHRKSKAGEKIITLDNIERELPENAIIIEDEKQIFDLAGIMGGASSEIKNETKNIWLHVAVYNKILIRRAAVKMGHRTDAATINEKGVPPHFAYEAVLRSLELIKESCPEAKITSRILDIKNYEEKDLKIDVHLNFVERLAGISFKVLEITNILKNLGFKILSENEQIISVQVPGWRTGDVHNQADIIEEIIRIYGFNKIPAILPHGPIKVAVRPPDKILAKKTRQLLVSMGLQEVYTFSFLGKELLQKFGEKKLNQNYIEISNFITEDISIMRQSLLPRMLEIIESNLRYQKEVNIFEISKIYRQEKNQINEPQMLCGILASKNANFRDTKGIIETLLNRLNITPSFKYIESNTAAFIHPSRNTEIIVAGQSIGLITELHPQIKQNFSLDKVSIYLFELNFETLVKLQHKVTVYKPLLKHPTITLDISVLIDKYIVAGNFLDKIKNIHPELINEIKIIDEYIGNNIPSDKRNITFSVTYAASDRTLKDEEISTIHQEIIKKLATAGAELRK